MIKFFQMGGYAVYLWPCYALTLLVLVANIVAARRSLERAQRDARRRLARAAQRAGMGSGAGSA
jgi:heme exporter protein D